jgi:hypothetical protein
MIRFENTEARIAFYLKQMQMAMPEIKRQIEVYQAATKSGLLPNSTVTVSQNV